MRPARIPRVERPCGICGAVIQVRVDLLAEREWFWCSPRCRGEGRVRTGQAGREVAPPNKAMCHAA